MDAVSHSYTGVVRSFGKTPTNEEPPTNKARRELKSGWPQTWDEEGFMILSLGKRILLLLMPCILAWSTITVDAGAQQSESSSYTGQGSPLTAQELQSLVAPIALYPDALVAQIL